MATQRITELLAIEQPIIQAPMLGVSTPALAAAVSNAGGLGSISLAASTPEQGRALIAELRGLTDRPFNINLFCHRPQVSSPEAQAAWLEHLRPFFAEFDAAPPSELREIYRSFSSDAGMQAMLLETRPAVVSFHFGLPEKAWIAALQQAGMRVLACVTTPAEADLAIAAGVDALIAQGIEAGGHRGLFEPAQGDLGLGTLNLVRQLVQRSALPVIAAGGIMDGASISAALALGAAGVQMGTAFVLCPESAANAAYRTALKGEKAYRTQITTAMSGRPARGLPNRMFSEVGAADAPALPGYSYTYDATKALQTAAVARGNHDFAAQWAGQGAPLAREMPAGELVAVLVSEMNR
ncbi:nitronate monooxygenase [Pseudomonas sp. PDM14]|uniref:NAD(P)H-dependent flavin oxidoreductase n=1 Tax=Pseudomonas sp. PDM14 TaxID=2769288 RepID=UPI00178271A9|nr:nitronate monooxygenase family protein [Pseudomonas sp. PDM14]MBD9482909.1 nitronate monooxygenase [Pseudomonas sp. PDM14]